MVKTRSGSKPKISAGPKSQIKFLKLSSYELQSADASKEGQWQLNQRRLEGIRRQ